MLYSELPDDNDDNSNIIWCFGDTTMKMCGHVHTGAAHEAKFDKPTKGTYGARSGSELFSRGELFRDTFYNTVYM